MSYKKNDKKIGQIKTHDLMNLSQRVNILFFDLLTTKTKKKRDPNSNDLACLFAIGFFRPKIRLGKKIRIYLPI